MIGAALWFLRRWWKPILLVLVLAALAAVIAHAVLAYGGRRYQAGHDAVVASDAAAAIMRTPQITAPCRFDYFANSA